MSKLATNYLLLATLVSLCGGCEIKPELYDPAGQERLKVNSLDAYTRAIKLAKAGDDEQAIIYFKLFNRQFPNVANSYTNLGLLYLKQNNIKLAEHYLEKAIEIDPQDKIAHNHIGVISRQLGRFEQARMAYLSALNIDSDYADAHYNLAILYDVYLGKLTLALTHYQHYQQLTEGGDREVEKWIIDLQRRIPETASRQ